MESSRIAVNKKTYLLAVIWFFLGILFGFYFGQFDSGGLITYKLYSGYNGYVENYSSFCWATMFYIVSSPLIFIVLWRYKFLDVILSRGTRLVFFAAAVSATAVSLGFVGIEGKNIFSKSARLIAEQFDWIGLALIFFGGIYVLIVSCIILINSPRRVR